MDKLQFDNQRSRVQECPCGKSNKDGKFTPYKDHNDKGYCHACGETFLPKLQTDNTEQWRQSEAFKTKTEPTTQFLTSLDYGYFSKTLSEEYQVKNVFIQFLKAFFKPQAINEALAMYHIGTHYDSKNACLFWYLDEKNICRAKAMCYDTATCNAPFTHQNGICKRDKTNPYSTIEITKNILKRMGKENYSTPRCFFGSHLLSLQMFQDLPIGIVEAEKTAVIASICNPDFSWLAVGGMQRLDLNLFQTLKGREIWLFPDLGSPNPKTKLTPFQDWQTKLDAIRCVTGSEVYISQTLEQDCSQTEREKGYDLADYYLENHRQEHHFLIKI
jgi:Domain of unknown function (DUF6371)